MKKIALVLGLLLATPAFAADNAVIVTPGVGVTMKSKDIGAGVQAMQPILSDASGNTLLTTVGADAVSNTLTGIPVYSRQLFFNGTTWDRWQGLVTATLAAETTKVIGTVRVASGGIAAGSLAAGAGVDGWDLAAGATTDAAVTAGATGSVSAKLRSISRDVMTTNTWAGGTLGAMAAYGTSPGAVNVPGVNAFVTNTLAAGQATMANSSPVVLPSNMAAIALWGHGATGAAVPANATYAGVLDAAGGTNMLGLAGDPCQTSVKSTLPITLATAAVKVIAVGVSAKKIYVCQIHLTNNAADSVAVFEATTATTCATSPVAVVGAGTTVATAATGYNFAANGGISLGTGSNQILQTATNANDLCIAQSAATQLTGSITYVTR